MRLSKLHLGLAFVITVLFWTKESAAFKYVRMETNLGTIDVELFDTVAPLSVNNFLNYVRDGDYDNSIFHRNLESPSTPATPVLAVRGGGFTVSGSTFSPIPKDPPILNEFALPNIRGTLSVARDDSSDPASGTSQWFFNVTNNAGFDQVGNRHAVFGRIVGPGMAVIDRIARLPVTSTPQFLALPVFSLSAPVDEDNVVIITRIFEVTDSDGDRVPDVAEDEAENNGDGNGDGIPDRDQAQVLSIGDAFGGRITLEVDPGISLSRLLSHELPAPGVTSEDFQIPGIGNRTIFFSSGFFSFTLENVSGPTLLKMYFPNEVRPSAYYKFGPTVDNPENHLYEFTFDGTTGAQVAGNVLTLSLVDGGRGDNDGAADGEINDPGGPAQIAQVGDSGCSATGAATTPAQRGDLALVALFLAGLYSLRRRHTPRGVQH